MVSGLIGDAEVLASGMRAEVDRAKAAVQAARAGHTVAVVSSGDAGVYGMAGLVLEVLGEGSGDDAVEIAVVPGMTAALAASAVLGAPLTNDFASISLSDLLTPLPVIERRLSAVAAADLVVALYNPRSNTRTEPLDLALRILIESRGPQTLVGVVRDALRDGQQARVTTLGELAEQPETVDMSTILVVGNSLTRLIGGRMVTPRGYPL